jgi:hypothetical protein
MRLSGKLLDADSNDIGGLPVDPKLDVYLPEPREAARKGDVHLIESGQILFPCVNWRPFNSADFHAYIFQQDEVVAAAPI